MTMIPIESVVVDEEIWPRNGVSGPNIAKIADAMEIGEEIPSIIVDENHVLVDGRHRLEAHKRLKRSEIDVIIRKYADEGERLIDAIETNIKHGVPLDSYDIRRAVAKLNKLGYSKEAIAGVIRVPPVTVERIVRGFAHAKSGDVVPLKRGLSHLAGKTITKKAQDAVRKYGGMEGTYYARQLLILLDNGMFRSTPEFEEAMNSVCAAWDVIVQGKQAG